MRGCDSLTGKQRHPNGAVNVHLNRDGSAPRHRSPRLRNASAQSIDGKTFAGTWQWGSYARKRQVSFELKAGRLRATVSENGRSSRPTTVEIRGKWLTYTYRLNNRQVTEFAAISQSGNLVVVRQRKSMVVFGQMGQVS